MDLKNTLLLLLTILVLLALRSYGSVLLIRRANKNIIKKLREKNALSPEQAITREDVGIKKQVLLVKLLKARDNGLEALKFLLKAGVVEITEEELIYLSEERLLALQTGQKKEFKYLLPPEL